MKRFIKASQENTSCVFQNGYADYIRLLSPADSHNNSFKVTRGSFLNNSLQFYNKKGTEKNCSARSVHPDCFVRAAAVVEGISEEELLPDLPLLRALKKKIGSINQDIGGLIGLQHLMGSTASLMKHLSEERLSPDSVFLLGKPYSTCIGVMHRLAGMGFKVHSGSALQEVNTPHNDSLRGRIEELLRAFRIWKMHHVNRQNKRVLLIDDGGHAIEALHEKQFDDIRPWFTCVEQTRSGIRQIERINLQVPVINVAESNVKLELESPMIADSVKNEVLFELRSLVALGIPVGRRVLVIGYGSVGRCVSQRLRTCGFQVKVFDTSSLHGKKAWSEGFSVLNNYHQALSESDIIIGCTGTPVMDEEDYVHLSDNAILMSASSSDIEFNAWKLRRKAQRVGRASADNSAFKIEYLSGEGSIGIKNTEPNPCFDLYKVKLDSGTVYLVKGGFPVNFNGKADSISPDRIQLTRSLLYAGAVQASCTLNPGIFDLSESYQRLLLENIDVRTLLSSDHEYQEEVF